MIISESLARLRILLNESTAGFYTDTQLYQLLDSGQNLVVDFCLAKSQSLRNNDMSNEIKVFEPLSLLDTSNTTVTGTREYSLQTDYLVTQYCSYQVDDRSGSKYPAKQTTFHEALWKESNTYATANDRYPAYYIRAGKIGFSPNCVHGGPSMYEHYYYKKPTTIVSGNASSEITLRVDAHEAIIFFAYSLAMTMDEQHNEANLYFEKAIQIINNIG